MESLFPIFDKLPQKIGMTPIIRPFMLKSSSDYGEVLSILTMIAESHISLHYFVECNQAYTDLFSCKFFTYQPVVAQLRQIFGDNVDNEVLISRGIHYQEYASVPETQRLSTRSWLRNI